MLTNDGRCTCEIKPRIAMAKAAFIKKRALFTSTLDLELRKKLVKCYIWSIALFFLFYFLIFFLSNATTCPFGLRGSPSWAWQECNRLLKLGRP